MTERGEQNEACGKDSPCAHNHPAGNRRLCKGIHQCRKHKRLDSTEQPRKKSKNRRIHKTGSSRVQHADMQPAKPLLQHMHRKAANAEPGRRHNHNTGQAVHRHKLRNKLSCTAKHNAHTQRPAKAQQPWATYALRGLHR